MFKGQIISIVCIGATYQMLEELFEMKRKNLHSNLSVELKIEFKKSLNIRHDF